MTPAERRDLIADLAEVGNINLQRRKAAARRVPPAPLAKARSAMGPLEFAATFSGLSEMIDYLDKSGREAMVKARPAARRSAPPVAKPAPRRATVPADWLSQIRADQQAVENNVFRQRLRAASAQVARGEVSAIDAARIDIANHRAAALGVWR